MPGRTSGFRRAGDFTPSGEYALGGEISQVHVTCKGRKFGSWIDADARANGYNAADLIENPAYIIESILRDVLGHTSTVINYASFDEVANTTNGKRNGWKFARSITAQGNSLAAVQEICENSGMVLVHDYANQERLVALDHYSPTDSLANAEIVFEDGKPQARVRQTNTQYIYNEFYLNYKYNYGSGNFDKQLFITATANNLAANARSDTTYPLYGNATGLCEGSQTMYNVVRRWTYDAPWIREDATAELFIKFVADWLAIRKWEIDALLHYTAKTLKLEVMDQVTWNLDLLPASMRDEQVTDLAAAQGSGGTLANGTYYYVVTVTDRYGEGKKCAELTAVVASGGGTAVLDLTWSAVAGATGYRIYRATVSGTYTGYLTSATNSKTDTGAALTLGTPPSGSAAFFITRVVDYGLKGGSRVRMSFILCPYIFL